MKIKLPLFMVFEGIDGSGKTTLCELLFNYLKNLEIPVVKTQEPTDGYWGKQIRKILRQGGASPEEFLELSLNDRKDDVYNTILPALNRGKAIIADRYYFSNIAYQGATGISPAAVLQKNIEKKFPEPNRVYFIDIDPDTAIKRLSDRNKNIKNTIFEKREILIKVREIYNLIKTDKFLLIDGNNKPEKSLEIIINDISGNFNNKTFEADKSD